MDLFFLLILLLIPLFCCCCCLPHAFYYLLPPVGSPGSPSALDAGGEKKKTNKQEESFADLDAHYRSVTFGPVQGPKQVGNISICTSTSSIMLFRLLFLSFSFAIWFVAFIIFDGFFAISSPRFLSIIHFLFLYFFYESCRSSTCVYIPPMLCVGSSFFSSKDLFRNVVAVMAGWENWPFEGASSSDAVVVYQKM